MGQSLDSSAFEGLDLTPGSIFGGEGSRFAETMPIRMTTPHGYYDYLLLFTYLLACLLTCLTAYWLTCLLAPTTTTTATTTTTTTTTAAATAATTTTTAAATAATTTTTATTTGTTIRVCLASGHVARLASNNVFDTPITKVHVEHRSVEPSVLSRQPFVDKHGTLNALRSEEA